MFDKAITSSLKTESRWLRAAYERVKDKWDTTHDTGFSDTASLTDAMSAPANKVLGEDIFLKVGYTTMFLRSSFQKPKSIKRSCTLLLAALLASSCEGTESSNSSGDLLRKMERVGLASKFGDVAELNQTFGIHLTLERGAFSALRPEMTTYFYSPLNNVAMGIAQPSLTITIFEKPAGGRRFLAYGVFIFNRLSDYMCIQEHDLIKLISGKYPYEATVTSLRSSTYMLGHRSGEKRSLNYSRPVDDSGCIPSISVIANERS